MQYIAPPASIVCVYTACKLYNITHSGEMACVFFSEVIRWLADCDIIHKVDNWTFDDVIICTVMLISQQHCVLIRTAVSAARRHLWGSRLKSGGQKPSRQHSPCCVHSAAGKLAWLYIWYTWWRHQMEIFSALLVIHPRLIPRSPVNSPHKGQWRGALKFSLICFWINDWVNNREAGDLIRHRAHYDVIIMIGGLPVCVLSQISSHETGHRPPIICTGD